MGGWWSNIGNAFIDIGAYYMLRQLVGEENIYVISGTQYYPHRKGKYPDFIRDSSVDYIVFSGMVFAGTAIGYYEESLRERTNDARIIFNGAGGNHYDSAEIDKSKKFLNAIDAYAIISRDEISYNEYKEYGEYSHNGIDVAFSIPLFYEPPVINDKYIVINDVDNVKKDSDAKTYRTYHDCSKYKDSRSVMDTPWHYINLYSNAMEVHTSRMHGTIIALDYEVPVKLYLKPSTKRQAMFKRLNIEDIYNKPVCIPYEIIEDEVREQMLFLHKIIT